MPPFVSSSQQRLKGTTLTEEEKRHYLKILRQEEGQPLLEQSLLLITTWLHRFYNQRVILLIDEYDSPTHAPYVGRYYDKLIYFLRNWLSAGLKDNLHLEKGVLTGILRIAKESVFSGLNNINTFTIDLFQNSGFVDFRDYFDLFSIFFAGVISTSYITPAKKSRKIGSKEPAN